MEELPEHKPSVFVVDGDRLLLDSLEELSNVLNCQVRTFSDPRSFERFYCADMPGCLIFDIRAPRPNELASYEQLLFEDRRIPVIFVAAQANVSTAVAAMKNGATEFLEKPVDRKTLLDRVEQALALDAEWRRQDSDYAALARRINQLSERERETLELIHAGESNKSMANKLFISERAIEMRRAAIMKKLRVGSMAEMVNLTTTHRILTEMRRMSADPRLRSLGQPESGPPSRRTH
jgi:FixJ family two-component response regulator